MRCAAVLGVLFLLVAGPVLAGVLVDIPLDQQVNIGLGDAITNHTTFGSDPGGGYVRRDLTPDNGAGGWYFGPTIDVIKAGYGPYVDMSGDDVIIEYTARYFQGGGNTNPYADAPIFIQLMDSEGRGRSLGISYGPQPNPTYPEWITCQNTVVPGEGDPSFDPTKVVRIEFFGTDWAGTGDDFIEIRNLRVLDSVTHNPIPIAHAKASQGLVEIAGVVCASFPQFSSFYVEEPQRTSGVLVISDNVPGVGSAVFVQGIPSGDPYTGEMRIECTAWFRNGTGEVEPLCVTSRALGGGAQGRQDAVFGGVGLCNVGMLVRMAGIVTSASEDLSWACISDDPGVSCGGPTDGVVVDLSFIPFWQRPTIAVGRRAIVTGISRVRLGDDGERHRTILLRSASDFVDLDRPGNEPKTIRVAVVNFDPHCPGYGNRRTHDVFGWNDPMTLTFDYVADLLECSGEWANYRIDSWFDADYHPHFRDGFQYSPDDYVYAWTNHETEPMHEGQADYVRLLTDPSYPHNQPTTLADRIANDEIDEVFFFDGPGAVGFWEASMAGPSPFFVNGGTYQIPEAGRNFVIMGFNYERGVDCMLEDFCHRTECVMSRVYPSPNWWFPTYPPIHNWDAFRMFDVIEPDKAACGICHYAPNSESDYDWGNPRYVWSTCDDWLYNWPNLAGEITRRWVNCEEWGNGDMRLHHIWWLEHLPKAQGINPDSRQNNWWKYTCDFNNYPESR